MVMAWKDKKVVRMISTRHADVMQQVVRWNPVLKVVDGRRKKIYQKVCL